MLVSITSENTFCLTRFLLRERMISERYVEKPRLFEHSLEVAERPETVLAVIPARTAVPDAAEGRTRRGDMEETVIDAPTAKRYLINYLLCSFPVLGETVKCQRLRLSLNLGDKILERVVRDDGKDRAENLFRHDGRIFSGINKDGRFDLQQVTITMATYSDLLSLNEMH